MTSEAACEVSIIVPAFNAGEDLEKNLPALKRETVRVAAEILVVDDGSEDDTARIARDLDAFVLSQPNRGPAAARNLGARHARAPILVFLDADCTPTPGWLDQLLAPLADPEIAAVKAAYLTHQSSWTARLAQIEFGERYDLLRRAERIDMVDSFSMAIRKAVFDAVLGFDESFPVADNEDVDLSYRLVARGHRLAFADKARVYHRHPATLSAYIRLKHSRAYYRTLVYERFPQRALRDSYTPATLKFQTVSLPLLCLLSALLLLPLPAIVQLRPWLAAATASLLVALGLTAAPFLHRIGHDDPSLLLVAPVFLAARAAALSTGMLRRLLRLPPPIPKRR